MSEQRSLLLFQMGPVQEFIAQAATPKDLWAGSYLLSSLIYAGLEKLVSLDGMSEADVVFPNLTDGTIKAALDDAIPTLPNRFLAFVPNGKGPVYAEEVEEAITARLKGYVACNIPGFQKQVEQFLQMTYAILPKPSGDMGDDYTAVGKMLAARRNVRQFGPWEESVTAQGQAKDFLTGKESALRDGLGAMNLVKRRLEEEFKGKLGDYKVTTKDDKYLAVIAMDGDRMGAALSGFKTEYEHQAFSTQLAQFALSVREPIERFGGHLIYAGGDDVLAVVPATKALACADELQRIFRRRLPQLTASAGVAVGHDKTPLQDVILAAQKAEHRAKHVYGRNALALNVFKRSGEILEWGCKWESKGIPLFERLATGINKNREKDSGVAFGAVLSARFPYKLAGLLDPYDLEQAKWDDGARRGMEDVVRAELKFALDQSRLPGVGPEQIAEIEGLATAYLTEMFRLDKEGDSYKYHPIDFLNVFMCETFIDRPRENN